MNRGFLTLSLLEMIVVLNTKLSGQFVAPPIEWERCYGGSNFEQGTSISTTNDGGYIFAGCTSSIDGDILTADGIGCDYWYVKIDASQNIIFKWNPGGTGVDVARSSFQTSDGGYLIGGYAESYNGTVTCSKANYLQADFWVLKLDAGGNLQWQKCYGGTDADYYGDGAEVLGSGYIHCGRTNSNDDDVSGNHGSSDFWLVKTDYSGSIEWAKCYGGSDYDIAYDVKPCMDRGYIVVGLTESQDGDVAGNHGSIDGWALKTDSSGNIQWTKCFGGSNQDEFYKVIQLRNGNFVMAGWTSSSDGDISFLHGNNYQEDAWLVMTDASGNLLWSKTYGGNLNDEFSSLVQDEYGKIDAVGYSASNDGDLPGNFGGSDYWLAGIDTNGALLWSGNYGGSGDDNCSDVATTPDGGLVVNGSSNSEDGEVTGLHDLISFYYPDYWVVKFSSVVGINAPENFSVRINPTITHDLIQITNVDLQKVSELRITSANGKQMLEEGISRSADLVLNVSSFSPGIYFVEVMGSQSNSIAKFMKY